MELLLVMLLLFVFFSLVCFWMFFFSLTLCMAQEGYLHVVNASSMCVNSSFFCSWLEQMLLALCNKEFITLNLLAMEWWLSHCKYWLVWVGFLYMEVDKLPSSFTVTRVSRKGRNPSALVFSAVNWIFSSKLFKCWKNSSLCAVFLDDKSVIHIPLPKAWGVWCCFKGPGFKVLHIYVCHNGAEWRPHGCTFSLFKVLPLKDKACASQAELQQLDDVPCVHACSSW